MREDKASVYAGRAGERSVAKILAGLPKDKYKVLNDLLLRTKYGTSQIDHLVIGAAGVFVIETKNYAGVVTGTDKDRAWTQSSRSFYNPVRQNFTHIQALTQLLKPVVGNVPFLSVVVFPETCELHIHSRSCVVRYQELPDAILAKKAEVLSTEKQEKIYAFLQERNITDAASRRAHARSVRRKDGGKRTAGKKAEETE